MQRKTSAGAATTLALLSAAVALAPASFAADAAKRLPSDVAGVDFLVACRAGAAADYSAPTASGVPLDSPYARARAASKGLVSLMNEGGARVKRYVVARRRIVALVTVKYDTTIPEEADLLFTPDHLTLVRVSTANAGIFTVSDVYELPYAPNGGLDRKIVRDEELSRMLDLGLAAWRRDRRMCDLASVGAPAR